jgi:tetratricopeptide (TPR) repeat protein
MRWSAVTLVSGAALALAVLAFAQHPMGGKGHPEPTLPDRSAPLRKALLLLREGKTAEARVELVRLQKDEPASAEIPYQIARSYLLDFHILRDPAKQRVALSLAMEQLSSALKRNPEHIYALKAKSVIHARAELLYYDPNLAYELASRVVKLQPYANEFLLNISEWMTGEVRFTEQSDHRVPHDPQLGLDRSLDLIERVIDGSMPFSNEEAAALFLMAKTMSRRGNHRESIPYYRQALSRATTPEQRMEVLREQGSSHYRLGEFGDAARCFYQVLQVRMTAVDQWLLKVAMDQMGAAAPELPAEVIFPGQDAPAAKGLLLEFKDIAKDVGLNRFDGNGTVAWGDIDGDGDLDVILAGSGQFIGAYRNDRGKFTDVTNEVGLAKVPSGYSLNLVDYDNDGWLDLYVSLNGWSGPLPNMLFRNTGGKFVNVSKESGADDPGIGFVSLWGDLDNDGYLDLVIANGVLKDGSVPQIYRNNRDGTFTNVTREAGIDEPPTHGTIGAALGDYDRDGDLDIFFNGLNNSPNRLYRNDGKWKFTEVTAKAGVHQPPHNGFVCFFQDFTNDAYPDIVTVSLAPWDMVVQALSRHFSVPGKQSIHPDSTRLFRNNKNGTFTDITWESKLYVPTGSMGSGVADVDNNGHLDLYIGTGDPQLSRLEPNHLLVNNGDGTFTDVTAIAGFARPGNKGHGVAFVDIDDDGDLDIFAQLGGHYQGDFAENAFYRNLKGNQNRWLQIELRGVKSNRFAVGAQLTAKAGDLTVYREIKGSEGFGATNPYRVHFGFGKRTRVDSLEIRWPSGRTHEFSGIDTNQILGLKEDEEQFKPLRRP